MQKITPFLWFDNNAEEAIQLYASIFKGAKILETSRYPEGGPVPGGTLMSATLQLGDLKIVAFNGGPMFKFNESMSLFVDVESQTELDDIWNKLLAGGGKASRCGWLKDKFGLSWQIIPTTLGRYLQDKDPKKSGRVMEAMMKMDKIIIKDLEKAYQG